VFNRGIALFQNSLSGGLTHAQSEVNSCFDLLHFLGAQGGKPIAKTVFGYGGNSIQVSNAVLGHAVIGSQGHFGGDMTDMRGNWCYDNQGADDISLITG